MKQCGKIVFPETESLVENVYNIPELTLIPARGEMGEDGRQSVHVKQCIPFIRYNRVTKSIVPKYRE